MRNAKREHGYPLLLSSLCPLLYKIFILTFQKKLQNWNKITSRWLLGFQLDGVSLFGSFNSRQ